MSQSTHRTPEQWQALVDQWQRSGQSMARFCEAQGQKMENYAHNCKLPRKAGRPGDGDICIQQCS